MAALPPELMLMLIAPQRQTSEMSLYCNTFVRINLVANALLRCNSRLVGGGFKILGKQSRSSTGRDQWLLAQDLKAY